MPRREQRCNSLIRLFSSRIQFATRRTDKIQGWIFQHLPSASTTKRIKINRLPDLSASRHILDRETPRPPRHITVETRFGANESAGRVGSSGQIDSNAANMLANSKGTKTIKLSISVSGTLINSTSQIKA